MENKINWMKENSSGNWAEKRNRRKQKQSIKQTEGIWRKVKKSLKIEANSTAE